MTHNPTLKLEKVEEEEIEGPNIRQRLRDSKALFKPKMPELSEGVSGLAAIIKYAIELKMFEEANGQSNKFTQKEKLTGIAKKMQENFQIRMNELQEIKELIITLKYAKNELLENMMQETNFKVHLRPN